MVCAVWGLYFPSIPSGLRKPSYTELAIFFVCLGNYIEKIVCKCDCGCVGGRESSQLLEQQSVLLLEGTENKYPCSLELSRTQSTSWAMWVEGSCHRALQPHLGVARFLGPGFPLACVYSESESHLERRGSQEWLWGEEECRLIGQRCHCKG